MERRRVLGRGPQALRVGVLPPGRRALRDRHRRGRPPAQGARAVPGRGRRGAVPRRPVGPGGRAHERPLPGRGRAEVPRPHDGQAALADPAGPGEDADLAGQRLGRPLQVSAVVELTSALIAARSPNPPGDERAAAAVAAEALPAAPRVIASAPERPNLLATLDFGPGGRHLVLCGHIDTKPVGGARWSVDPFAATIDGDRLYGLGSTDMKGAVAAMIVAARDPDLPRGRLSLLLVADEESGAAYGARHVASEVEADAIVIGEPCGVVTDFDRLPLVSRGIARFRAVARGEQGHSSLAEGPDNAGVSAARAVVALADGPPLTAPAN